MTATHIDALFAALANGDLSAVVPLADALEEDGRTGEASLLRGEDAGSVYVVPAFQLVTTIRPDFRQDGRKHQNILTVKEGGFGRFTNCTRRLKGTPVRRGTPAFTRVVNGDWSIGRINPTRQHGKEITVYIIDAAEYGLAQ